MKVSVVVVCYNERENIEACLASLRDLTGAGTNAEILFVDNGSDDGTVQILERHTRSNAAIRLLHNPVRSIARSRNMGWRAAGHDMVAFLDADCVAPPHWLETLVRGFERHRARRPKLAAVGGANVPPRQRSRFYDVLGIFLNTYLGAHSSVQGRRFSRDRIVDHLPTVNVLYLKKALAAVNGFDERMGNIGEDQDLSFRLKAHGFSLHYIAGAEVIHALRSNLAAWSRNMFIYGTGRMRLMRLHPRRIQVKFIVPLLLVLVLALIPFITVLVPVLLYFPAVFLVSLFEGVRARRADLVADLFAVYISTHICYGLGEWYALIRPCRRSRAEPRNR